MANVGKHVVSLPSSASVTVVATATVSVVSASVPAVLGNTTSTSAVLAAPISVTPFVPLSVPSRNLILPPTVVLVAPITRLCPVAVVVVAATLVIRSVPSTSIVTLPVPVSATVTLLLPCEIAVVLTLLTCESTYALVAACWLPVGSNTFWI